MLRRVERERRRRRRRQEMVIVLSLLVVLLVTGFSYLSFVHQGTRDSFNQLLSLFSEPEQPKYQENQYVLWANPSETEQPKKVGKISSQNPERGFFQKAPTYELELFDGSSKKVVLEEDLTPISLLLAPGDKVSLLEDPERGEALITGLDLISEETMAFRYTVIFEADHMHEQVLLKDLVPVFSIPLREDNTGIENHAIIQQAIERSKAFSAAVIDFPEGAFYIGSHQRDKDYLLLSSHIWFRGNQTTLKVSGAARWFGLATGAMASDGVSDFKMTGFDIRAENLETGSQFLVMANHGQGWHIEGNRFTMVHSLGSHVFDLGGLQDSQFLSNQFIGYAPELTGVETISGRQPHDFYAEAIQLDVSDASVPWDGGMMAEIDPNYAANSQERLMSQNIVIAYNQFLPYKDDHDNIKAYSASVGQHSSEVGYVAIYQNLFQDSLVKRYQVTGDLSWYFDPILIRSHEQVYIADNQFD